MSKSKNKCNKQNMHEDSSKMIKFDNKNIDHDVMNDPSNKLHQFKNDKIFKKMNYCLNNVLNNQI
jgi:hypothetical protein